MASRNLWQPTTGGEGFYFFVHEAIGSRADISLKLEGDERVSLPMDSVQQPFVQWIGHAFTGQIVARSLRNIKSKFGEDTSDPGLARREVQQYATDRLGLTSAIIDMDEFSTRCVVAWESGKRRNISADQQQRILEDWLSSKCYLCGSETLASEDKKEKRRRTADHLWPASLGGDTIDENLAICCHDCNQHRSDLFGWPWGPVHRYFRRQESIGKDQNALWLWIPVHLRAVMTYAMENGTSLKEAARLIGPRASWRCNDTSDVAHFFNLRTTEAA